MSRIEIELNPVTHITTDAIGKPGQRVFFIQARKEAETVTLLVEKVQIQTLALGVEQFLTEIAIRFPDLPPASADYEEAKMRIYPPVDPVFRVGELGLGYDEPSDLMLIIAHEVTADGASESEEEVGIARFWGTRSQMLALVRWGLEVANRGRPVCPQCGEPMEPEGHFCPKKNGHKH
jgi:uncharacterized repeat protein (TIGR03847 family)